MAKSTPAGKPHGPWARARTPASVPSGHVSLGSASDGADAATLPARPRRQFPTGDHDVPAVLEQGTRVERYIILKCVGQGGMGAVYAAYDPQLDRRVALKLLLSSPGDDDTSGGRARLQREAQAMARISHPNVIPVFDVGTFGRQVFVAMEFIQGQTLHEWMKQPRPWRELLRVFLEAGRGVAAAHKAGLVHRDFKPSNVLVGDDGRVCVMDFGLARLADGSGAEQEQEPGGAAEALESLDETPHPGGGLSSWAVTQAGAIVGTPQYMAPEQHLGDTVLDARTDQFSFCAALYLGLYRKRAFTPRDIARAAAHAQDSAPAEATDAWRYLPHGSGAREPPRQVRVPSWLRGALMRGLSLHPDDRFPSMEALLEALSQEGRQVRRRWALAVVGTVALATAGGGAWLHQRGQVCEGAEQLVASSWGPDSRREVEAAFAATGRPFAGESTREVVRLLDGYTRDWARQHTEACEATRVRGVQTEELLSLRVVCLERRRKDLAALVRLFSQADGKVVEKAVDAAYALPSPRTCEDIGTLAGQDPLPEEPALRARIEALGERLAEVKALHDAGRYKDALGLARTLEPQVDATAYLPLQAELRYHLGWLRQMLGEAEAGILQLEQSFADAESSHADRIKFDVLLKLVFSLANQGELEQAERWGRLGGAVLRRLGGDALLEGDLMGNLGNVALRQGRYPEAKRYYEKARDLQKPLLAPGDPRRARVAYSLGNTALMMGEHARAIELLTEALRQTEAVKGPHHPELANRHYTLARALRESGQWEPALVHARAALELRRSTLGPEHPGVAEALDAVGMVLIAQGRHEEAVDTFGAAVELKRKVLGPEHPDLAYSYDGLGQARLAQGRISEALGPLSLALASTSIEPEALADTGFTLGQALWEVDEKARARAEVLRARERYQQVGKQERVAEVDTWLASHAHEAPRRRPAPKRRRR
jgi:serine/threonine protein kinase/tetratricopeptide (TPR) repeat protein